MNLIDQHINSIKQLCNQHKVEVLYVFGSVLTAEFQKESDVDFLVKFQPIPLPVYFDNYYNFKSSLETLLNRKVDLLEDQAIKNPILRESIDRSKKLVYGPADSKVAA
ncbi:MAG: nucleotidyltransferase family protein [Rufibacter sp.]